VAETKRNQRTGVDAYGGAEYSAFRAGWQAREQEVADVRADLSELRANCDGIEDAWRKAMAERDRALAEVGRLEGIERAAREYLNDSIPWSTTESLAKHERLGAALQPRGEGA
jgi:chromosome segregation ATPase